MRQPKDEHESFSESCHSLNIFGFATRERLTKQSFSNGYHDEKGQDSSDYAAFGPSLTALSRACLILMSTNCGKSALIRCFVCHLSLSPKRQQKKKASAPRQYKGPTTA